MENYKNIDLGYELWKNGYSLRNFSPAGEIAAHALYVSLYESGKVKNVLDFITWARTNEPNLIYNEYEEHQKYRAENEPKIRAYFAEHFEGRTWDKIDPERWDFYSDWHKDVFGYRPHAIVCGEYVNPHCLD